MSKGRRVERVASLIRRELGELLISGIRDERVNQGIVTITDVDLSGDLQHCKVFVSIYGEEVQKNNVMDGLDAANGFIRGELGRKLDMRRAPEIIFELDKGMEKGASVLHLLDQLEKGREKNAKLDSIDIDQ